MLSGGVAPRVRSWIMAPGCIMDPRSWIQGAHTWLQDPGFKAQKARSEPSDPGSWVRFWIHDHGSRILQPRTLDQALRPWILMEPGSIDSRTLDTRCYCKILDPRSWVEIPPSSTLSPNGPNILDPRYSPYSRCFERLGWLGGGGHNA